MEKRYTYEEFLEIIKTLRSENGCPWDREQTHESLRSCLMEEAAEVLAAIRIYDKTGNAENFKEELGDVLLQVVMHARIAEEEGIFTMEDVVNEVATKMVRRHPHVFGDTHVDNSTEVLVNWEEIKKKEKEGKVVSESPLREIPMELPALTRATKVLKKADKIYDIPLDEKESIQKICDLSETLKKVVNEESSLKRDSDEMEALQSALLGELLENVCKVSAVRKLTPEQILTDRVENFIDEIETKRLK